MSNRVITVLLVVLLAVPILSKVIEGVNPDIESILNIGEEIVGEYQGKEGVYEGISEGIKEDIEEIREGLKKLDEAELNVSKYKRVLEEKDEEPNQGVLDAGLYGEEEYPELKEEDKEIYQEEVRNDERLYTKGEEEYIKVKDLEFEKGIAFVEYESVNIGIKEEEVPITYKHMKGNLEYDFKLEGYEEKKGGLVEVRYKSIKGENRLKLTFKTDKKGEVEGVEVDLQENR